MKSVIYRIIGLILVCFLLYRPAPAHAEIELEDYFSVMPPVGKDSLKFFLYFEKSPYTETQYETFKVVEDTLCDVAESPINCSKRGILRRSIFDRYLAMGLINSSKANPQWNEEVKIGMTYRFHRPFMCNVRIDPKLRLMLLPSRKTLKPLNLKSPPTWLFNGNDLSKPGDDWFVENARTLSKYDFFYDTASQIICLPLYTTLNRQKEVAEYAAFYYDMDEFLRNDEGHARELKFIYNMAPFMISGGVGSLVGRGIYMGAQALRAGQGVSMVSALAGGVASGIYSYGPSEDLSNWIRDVSDDYLARPQSYPSPAATLWTMLDALENKDNQTAWWSPTDQMKLSQYTDLGVLTGLTGNLKSGGILLDEGDNIVKLALRIRNILPNPAILDVKAIQVPGYAPHKIYKKKRYETLPVAD